jgi:voltage-gated potassium channel
MKIREKLYRVVEKDTEYFEWYDIMMLICIWVSIVPLIFKEQNKFTYVITIITTLIFVIDYILRWITSDYRLKKGVTSFIKYPITFSAIFDLTIIISCFSEFYNNPILTLFSTFRILMIAKTLRYSKKFKIIKNVVEKNKDILKVVCGFTIGFIFVSALIMFQFERQSFNNFFEAIYWSTTVLTTVGYGDICPKTEIGKLISIISSLVGIAFVALPTGIITTGFVEELNKEKEVDNNEKINKN